MPHTSLPKDQAERGARYRSQIDQFVSFHDVVGAAWHAWSDRFNAGDEHHQINLGLVQCTDPARGMKAGERWSDLHPMIAETNPAQ